MHWPAGCGPGMAAHESWVSGIASFMAERGTPAHHCEPGGSGGAASTDSLAPLHQPYNLAAIEAVFERMPDVPQVACFDTSFHRGHSGGCGTGAAAARPLSSGTCSATAFMACLTSILLPFCRK